MQVVILIPGSVTAGTEITIPSCYPDIGKLAYVAVISLVEGTPNTFDISEKEIVEGTPGAGQAAKKSDRGIVLGDDTGASDMLVVVYVAEGEVEGI